MIREAFLNQMKETLHSDTAMKADKLTPFNKAEQLLYDVITCILSPLYIREPTQKPFKNASYNWESNGLEETAVTKVITDLCEIDISTLYRAKLFDFLWITNSNFESSQTAILLYADYLETNDIDQEQVSALIRMYGLIKTTKSKKIDDDRLENIIKKICSQLKKSEGLLSMVLWMCQKNKLLAEGERYSLIEETFNQLIPDGRNAEPIQDYAELFEECYRAKNNVQKKKVISDKNIIIMRKKVVDGYLAAADLADSFPNQTFDAIGFIQKAVELLKSLDGTEEERRELLKKMAEKQKKIPDKMIRSEHMIDMSESVLELKKLFSGKTKDQCFKQLVMMPVLPADTIRNLLLENRLKYRLNDIITKEVIDKNGKTVVKLPPIYKNSSEPDLDSLEINAIDAAKMYINMQGAIISNALIIIAEEHQIMREDIEKIIEDSLFVPEEQYQAYLHGLMSGFENNYMSALTHLVPAVEYSVGLLAEVCGDVIYNLKESGLEEKKTMHAILELPKINEALDDDLIFTLKAVFTSSYGLNVRNNQAHGLLNGSFYNTPEAVYVWWLIFSLCTKYSKYLYT